MIENTRNDSGVNGCNNDQSPTKIEDSNSDLNLVTSHDCTSREFCLSYEESSTDSSLVIPINASDNSFDAEFINESTQRVIEVKDRDNYCSIGDDEGHVLCLKCQDAYSPSPLLSCTSCSISVHAACLGLSEEQWSKSLSANTWKCMQCMPVGFDSEKHSMQVIDDDVENTFTQTSNDSAGEVNTSYRDNTISRTTNPKSSDIAEEVIDLAGTSPKGILDKHKRLVSTFHFVPVSHQKNMKHYKIYQTNLANVNLAKLNDRAMRLKNDQSKRSKDRKHKKRRRKYR